MNTYFCVVFLLVVITFIPNANATINKKQLDALFKNYTEAWFKFRGTLEKENNGAEWVKSWGEVRKIKIELAGVDYILGICNLDEAGSDDFIPIYRKTDPDINEKGIAQNYKLQSIRLPSSLSTDNIDVFAYTEGEKLFGTAYNADRFSCVYKAFSGPTLAANGKDVASTTTCEYLFFIMGVADA